MHPESLPLRRIALLAAVLLVRAHAQLGAPEQWQCGNMETPMDRLLTQHVVPDVFPPNEYMSAYVAPALMGQADLIAAQQCAAVAVANWSPACTQHDNCMEARGANGKSSETCNDEILAGWTNACMAAYSTPGLGSATTPAEAWSQVFAPASGSGGNSSTYSATITTKIFCLASCVKMAKLAYMAMKTNTSSFQPNAYVPTTQSPFQGTTQNSPYIAELLGSAKEAQSYVKTGWTDASKTKFELTLKSNYWIRRYIGSTNLDEDYLFGYDFNEGDFTLEATVSDIILEGHPDYGKAGLAIRNNNETGATSLEWVIAKEGNLILRTHLSGGASEETKIPVGPSLPMGLKLARLGHRVLAYYRIGTGNWVLAGTRTMNFNKIVKAGLCVPYSFDYARADVVWYSEPHNAAFFKNVVKRRISGALQSSVVSLLLE